MTDEPECLPWGELSLANGDHSPRVFSRLQFSLSELFWQSLLRGPRLRTIIHNVFVSYLKNWQRSQIAAIIHISGFWNSCILKAGHDCTSLCASRTGFAAPGAPVDFTLRSRPALVLGFTLLTRSLITTSRPCCCFVLRRLVFLLRTQLSFLLRTMIRIINFI